MSDIPEIPTIETDSEIPTTDVPEVANIPEVNEEGLNPSEETDVESEDTTETEKTPEELHEETELEEFVEKRNKDINEEIEDTLNNPQNEVNSYLIEQLEEPEAKDTEVGKEQLLTIDKINQQIKEEGDRAKEDITQISGLDSENSNKEENLVKGVDKPAETLPSEEVIEEEWGWFDEEIDPEIEDFLKSIGEEEQTGRLSPEELRVFEDLRQSILDRFPVVGSTSSFGTLNSMLDAMPNEEENATKETIKILLRLAVRLGTRIVALIADEIVKSADKDDSTTRFIFGAVRESAKGIESAADTFITGKDRADRLTKDIRNRLFRKK